MTEKLKAFFIFCVVLGILFFPVLFNKKILLPLDQLNTMFQPFSEKYQNVEVFNHFFVDGLTQYYPYKLITQKALQTGNLAFWNPNESCGYPHFAETMAAHFDITNIVLPFLPMPLVYHLQIFLQFLIAGMGMFLLLRAYKISFWIAILFASSYMLNSMFVTNIFHRWILASFCWMPYVLIMLKQYFEKKDIASFLLGSLFLAFFFLGGSFQTAIYGIIVVLGYLLVENYNSRSFSIPSIFFKSSSFITIALLISAIMWLPSLELLWVDISDGESRIFGRPKNYSIIDRILSMPMLISFYFPQLLGSVRGFDLSKIANTNLIDFNGFIGFAPLFFAVWGGYYLWNKKNEIRAYYIFFIIGIILPLFTPLYNLLYHRFFIISIFGAIIVGAMTLQTFIEKSDIWESFRKYYKVNIIVFLGIIFSLLITTIAITFYYDPIYALAKEFIVQKMSDGQGAFRVFEDWMINRIHVTMEHFLITSYSMYISLLSISAIFIITYLFKKKSIISRKKFETSVFTITIIQLFQFSWDMIPMSDSKRYPIYPITKEIKYIQSDLDDFRVLSYNYNSDGRGGKQIGAPLIFPSNILPNVYNIATSDGYESIRVPNLSQIIARSGRELNANMLGLTNVKYILTNNQVVINNTEEFELVQNSGIKIYKNKKYLPRIYLNYKYQTFQDTTDLMKQINSKNYTHGAVFFNNEPTIKIDNQNVENHVNLIVEKNNYLKINVYSKEEGYLILSDTYYPGWECRINGEKTEILKANYSMRSVVVPAGNSSVEFEFIPVSFHIGAIITLVSCTLISFFICRKKWLDKIKN